MRHKGESLGKVLVLGLGKSGKAVVDYCLERLGGQVESLYIAAGERTPQAEAFVSEACARGAYAAFGDDAVVQLAQAAGGSFDVCIPSPGIPPASELYERGSVLSRAVFGEVELAWRESADDIRWVSVTGTNGKTTVTSLVTHLLNAAGMHACAVGNIGDTCIDAVAKGDAQVLVAETSSYQLHSTGEFAPEVAVFLNITPDHLKWHGSFEAYRDDKTKLLGQMAEASRRAAEAGAPATAATAVLDATNDVVRGEVRRLRQIPEEERGFGYIPLGTKAGVTGDMRAACGSVNAAYLGEDGVLHVAFNGVDHCLVRADELLIKGEHNVANALAASAAAIALGADSAAVCNGLRSFAPLEHRIEPCGTVSGVACYNDSKATNVDATLKAIAAFPETKPLILLGGRDKGTDLAPLVKAAHQHAKAVVCFGEAGARFEEAFALMQDQAPDSFATLRAEGMEDALDIALENAEAGEVVLLSPACASFDEFSCFEERGETFKALVAHRAAVRGA